MRVVVLAHPRSGTRYTAHCFRRAGWDVRQEEIGEDGIASWMWTVESEEVPNGVPRTGPIEADVILHVLREPAAAVSSVMHVEASSEAWRAKWVEIPMEAGPVERAIWSIYGWNHLIALQKPTLRAQIDYVEGAVEEITGTNPYQPSVVWYNSRQHPRFTADVIKATVWERHETAVLWDGLMYQYAEAAR